MAMRDQSWKELTRVRDDEFSTEFAIMVTRSSLRSYVVLRRARLRQQLFSSVVLTFLLFSTDLLSSSL